MDKQIIILTTDWLHALGQLRSMHVETRRVNQRIFLVVDVRVGVCVWKGQGHGNDDDGVDHVVGAGEWKEESKWVSEWVSEFGCNHWDFDWERVRCSSLILIFAYFDVNNFYVVVVVGAEGELQLDPDPKFPRLQLAEDDSDQVQVWECVCWKSVNGESVRVSPEWESVWINEWMGKFYSGINCCLLTIILNKLCND